jgi:hypothetical protein
MVLPGGLTLIRPCYQIKKTRAVAPLLLSAQWATCDLAASSLMPISRNGIVSCRKYAAHTEAFYSGDNAKLDTFIERYDPTDMVQALAGFSAETGAFCTPRRRPSGRRHASSAGRDRPKFRSCSDGTLTAIMAKSSVHSRRRLCWFPAKRQLLEVGDWIDEVRILMDHSAEQYV